MEGCVPDSKRYVPGFSAGHVNAAQPVPTVAVLGATGATVGQIAAAAATAGTSAAND
jgi:hypothetical protein